MCCTLDNLRPKNVGREHGQLPVKYAAFGTLDLQGNMGLFFSKGYFFSGFKQQIPLELEKNKDEL